MNNTCVYFVEGACEEKLINALKESPARIAPGKIKIFNVIQNELPRSILISIQPGSRVVFVFDTDVSRTDQLGKNIQRLRKLCSGVKIICLAQVLNVEDELVRCTDVSSPRELTKSRTDKDFKRDFCAVKDCRALLNRHHLDADRLWTTEPPSEFLFLPRNSSQIRLR
jgi:hypothetical protein